MHDVLIVGAGIGGLTLALELHQREIPCRMFESAPQIQAVGVGINILPHATRVLADLGLQDALAKVAVAALSDGYKRIAGYDRPALQGGQPQ